MYYTKKFRKKREDISNLRNFRIKKQEKNSEFSTFYKLVYLYDILKIDEIQHFLLVKMHETGRESLREE